ncbi:TolC family protein [Niastella caeni]|uniref:TolC family protein n=1 Tax=Niastella caeni TaxID=2569763 RepID=A0A4S8I0I5_9BACT|nr:TolC family protein [Niastella caeni]THU41460.1 TolC family protein [Niastella caeni]
MKKSKVLFLIPFLICCFSNGVFAQDKWDLRRCVEYALANNLTVQQTSIQAEVAEVNGKQTRWAQYPTADFSTNTGLQWGRSIDPTTNQFTSNQLLFQGYNFSAGVTVFNWHRIRNNIIATDLGTDAAKMDVEKTKNDIALNVATYYLQVLLARQQINIASVQMQQTMEQLQVARKRVIAGAAPELDALTLEGQYATDSSNYITAMANADQNMLQLKQVLNIDAGKLFDIASPPVEQIPIEPILQLQPEAVFLIAMKNQPAQKANELRLKSLEIAVKANKAAMYPTISLGGSLGTNFSSANRKVTDVSLLGYTPNGDLVRLSGAEYPVYSPNVQISQSKKTFGERWDGWGTQINNNFRQSLGFSISVPINSGGIARFNYQRSKLDLKGGQVTKALIDQTLKNDIYKAYYSATAALEKFNAAKLTLEINRKSYDFAKKRFDLGLLNSFDLITSKNNMNRAEYDLTAAQFDYVFKMKVLEFYKGQGIKL